MPIENVNKLLHYYIKILVLCQTIRNSSQENDYYSHYYNFVPSRRKMHTRTLRVTDIFLRYVRETFLITGISIKYMHIRYAQGLRNVVSMYIGNAIRTMYRDECRAFVGLSGFPGSRDGFRVSTYEMRRALLREM